MTCLCANKTFSAACQSLNHPMRLRQRSQGFNTFLPVDITAQQGNGPFLRAGPNHRFGKGISTRRARINDQLLEVRPDATLLLCGNCVSADSTLD